MADYFIVEKIREGETVQVSHFLQTRLWGDFKSQYGWESCYCRYSWRDYSGYLLVLVRKIARFIPFAYVPAGPSLVEIEEQDRELFLNRLARELQGIIPLGSLFIRFDLTDLSTFISDDSFSKPSSPFKKSVMDIQPPDTVVLELENRSPEEILAGMHKKWRYNIRLSEKKGIQIKNGSLEDIPSWYALYEETSNRDNIAIHSKEYYQLLFRMADHSDELSIRLFLAEYESELLAGIICIFQGNTATYLYGASSSSHRNLMPSYALQWAAIQEALAQGCDSYDFFGIPPSDDPDHPMAGLYRFKVNFGGKIVHYPGCWDYPCSRLFYFIYYFAEKVRKWYYKSFKKRK